MPRLMRLVPLFLIGSLGIAPSSGAQWNPLNPVESFQKDCDEATIFLNSGALRFQVCTDSMVRVLFSPEREFPKALDYVVIKSTWPKTPFDVTETAEAIFLTTAKLKLLVTKKDRVVVFYDSAGKKLAQEDDRTLTAAEVNGEKTYHLERFTNMSDTQEAFYGLGQHQGGVWNWRGESVDIGQDNTNISVPLLLSSNGYCIFWNNPSRSLKLAGACRTGTTGKPYLRREG